MIAVRTPLLLVALLNPFSWPLRHAREIGDSQPFATKVSQLRNADQRVLLSALKPVIASDLRFDFKENDPTELAEDVAAIVRSLRSEHLDTPKGPLTLVQAYTPEGCGAVGNCRVWVLDRFGRVLLHDARGIDFAVVTESQNYPSLVFAEHVNAGDRYLTLYRFNGQTYALSACGWSTMGYPGHYRMRPQISVTRCDERR